MSLKVHDVMDTSHPLSTLMRGEDRVSVVEGVSVSDVRVSVPDEAEKREYPIEDSDGLNAMEDTVRLDPAQMKRESLSEDDELNGLITSLPRSGLIVIKP